MKYWKLIILMAMLSAPIASPAKAQVMGNSRYPGSVPDNAPARSAGSYIYANNNNTKNFVSTGELELPPAPQENEVVISVSGIYNARPDEYVATFSLIQAGESAELTDMVMNTRIEAFKQGIKATGVKDADIYIDMISFIPKYQYELEQKIFSKTYNEVPSGFELKKNVSIRYKEPLALDKLISVATKSEIYDLVKVDCFIQNLQSYKDSLKTQCVNEIHEKIKLYKKLDIRLDTLKKTITEEFNQIYPQNRYSQYIAFSRPVAPSGKKSFLHTNENEKAISQYYNALDYNTFDIVMNPIILEPPIQIIYRLSIRYFLKKDEKRSESHYLLTPLVETTKTIR